MSGIHDVPRVKRLEKAAAQLRVSPRRLLEMESSVPWWTPSMRTEHGYDVIGIAVAKDAALLASLAKRKVQVNAIKTEETGPLSMVSAPVL